MVASSSATSGWQPQCSRPVGPDNYGPRRHQPAGRAARAARSRNGILDAVVGAAAHRQAAPLGEEPPRLRRPRRRRRPLPRHRGGPRRGRLRRLLPGRLGHVLRQRHPRRRGRPPSPRQAPAPRRGGPRSRPPRPGRGGRAHGRRPRPGLGAGGQPPGHRGGRLRGGDHGVLDATEARARGRPGLRVDGVRAAGHRRGRRHAECPCRTGSSSCRRSGRCSSSRASAAPSTPSSASCAARTARRSTPIPKRSCGRSGCSPPR